MKKIILIPLLLFFIFLPFILIPTLFFLLPITMTFNHDPLSHLYISDLVCQDPQSQNIPDLQVYCRNRVYGDASHLAMDLVVPSYWQSYYFGGGGGGIYGATHNQNFVDCLFEQATVLGEEKYRAIAIGGEFHLLTDSVKHNGDAPQHIPNVIRSTLITNIPMHPIAELEAYSVVDKDHPELFPRLQTVLSPFFNDPKAMQMYKTCATRQPSLVNFNVENAMQFLNDAFATPDGFFTKAFKLPDVYDSVIYGNLTYSVVLFLLAVLLIFIFIKIERWYFRLPLISFGVIFLILGGFFLIGGVSFFSNNPTFRADVYNVIEESKARILFITQPQNWSTRNQYDSSGFTSLKNADASTQILWIAIGLVILSVVIFSIYKWWKNR